MPKEIKEVTMFLQCRKLAKSVRIFRGKSETKFKLRTPKYLYTMTVKDPERAKKLEASLPPGKFLISFRCWCD